MKKLRYLLTLLIAHLSFASADNAAQNPLKVLIVGAGPAGLSAAKAFQNRGIYPDIIEKQAQIRFDGAGFAMPANGTWALDKLGIDISSKALAIEYMQFTDDQGNVLAREKIDDIHPEGAQFYSLSRGELIEQLLSSLDKRIKIQTDTTLKHFSEEDEHVKVELSTGEVRFYDIVIGSDGVHSSLRRQVYPDEPPEFLGLLACRTVIDDTEGVVMPTYILGPDRAMLLYPMLNNKTYVYGHVFQSETSPPLGAFTEVFSSF